MATLQDKFNKLYSARAKLEDELNNIYGELTMLWISKTGK